jgi:hypothetical protein
MNWWTDLKSKWKAYWGKWHQESDEAYEKERHIAVAPDSKTVGVADKIAGRKEAPKPKARKEAPKSKARK